MSPKGRLATFGNISVVGAIPAGLWWLEARNAAKHSLMYKAAPHTKWYPDPSNHRAEAEESCALQPPFFPCDRQEAGSAQTIQELQQNWNSIPETCDSKNQGLNLGLLHCRQVLYPPRNLGNLRISITLWLMHHAVPSTDCTALPTQ